MKNPLVFLTFIFLLITSCSLSDNESDLLNSMEDTELKSAKTDKYLPFKGALDITIDLPSIKMLPPKYQELNGQGNLTHLGISSLLIEQLWWLAEGVPGAVPRTGNGKGDITLTAANGDLLYATYNNAVAQHETETFVWVTFTAYFDGGTGRFENAEGSFEWYATFNPVLNKGKTTLSGIIRY